MREEARAGVGWAVVAVLFAATTCVESMSWNQLTAYTPLYLRELRVPVAQVPGWIAAISSLGWVLALPLAPFWGVLADRYSRKLIIVRSAVLEAVLFGGWALSTSPSMALLFRSLSGFVLGNTGVMLAMQASTTPRQRLALAVGIVGAGSPAGRALGPILGAALVHLVDVRGMLLFDAALSVLMALLLTVVMRESEHVRPDDVRVLSLLRGALAEIASKPLVWRLFLATTAAQVGMWTMLPYVPIYISRMTPSAACLALFVAGLSHWLPLFAIGLLTNGVCTAAILTASMAVMAATVSPERRGAVLGQILFPFYIGGVIGPVIGGVAFGYGQIAVFGIAAVLSVAPLAVLLTLRPSPAATRAA